MAIDGKDPLPDYAPPQLRLLSDHELASALQNGCNDALAVLFERHNGLVFRIARSIVKDDGEAEETVQQVFLDLFRAIAQFHPEKGSFKSWLLQFAYHRSINRREHLSAKRFYQFETLDEALALAREPRAPGGRQLTSQEIAHLVKQVLRLLPADQRTVIELTYFEGLTAEEIAGRIGESASAVRHNLYRGLSRLRHALLEPGPAAEKASKQRDGEEKGLLVAHPRTL
jgi:RNA polymerase sigma-70 factor, ECF subfamily